MNLKSWQADVPKFSWNFQLKLQISDSYVSRVPQDPGKDGRLGVARAKVGLQGRV